MIGEFLSSWLLQKLKIVADMLNRYNDNNVPQFVPDLKLFRLEDHHKLFNFDYVSMFTNVDVSANLSIIHEFYGAISKTTVLPLETFMRCLNFFIKDATYFGFDGILYYQSKGLAMGNRLAQILAEIRTNYDLLNVMQTIDAELMSFLYKYVDDVFSSIHEDHIDDVTRKITETVGMDITVSPEYDNCEVTFLDRTFKRNFDNSISSKWFKKECSSLSIINYHSNHPWPMIKKALSMTSTELLQPTRDLIISILEISSYPESFIRDIMISCEINKCKIQIWTIQICFLSILSTCL